MKIKNKYNERRAEGVKSRLPCNEEEETQNTILLQIQTQTQTQIHIQKQTQIQKRKVAANLVRGWGEGQYKARNHH